MIVASRYAKSLIDLSIESKQLEETRNDMKLVKQVCDENHDFVVLLNSPVVKTDKKVEILNSVFSGKISKLSLTFLNLLSKKRRESYIPEIAIAYDEQYKIKKHITTAVIKTATVLDTKLKSRVLEIVKQNTGEGEIELIENIDPSIIGGFVLSISDKQLDQSVKRKLNDLRKNLLSNKYIPSNN
ncbi:ATP synthase F1 subunit delta [Sediminibacterium sp.]|uniref:ATP synthase F1 subunit delta n=1 Tax=Sediminibacterium sp. TaxID=1917865 RepID=UPI00271BAC57|nr:ATP synthase F1 subunit delta [Sediminibacterium sp.]MDO9000317.1 ATP synthase F1 subunit delta [Bacteroidota bacterium]MDP3147114.1 ATP synthase F1 subunit delta [Bacteroidota bacterium]MDP3567357.1 ATP synthase F1 subunit delta [Sediminibacterium sp.]